MKLPNMLLGFAAIAAMAVNSQMGTTIRVAVGEGESLRYSPNNITAKVGTAIEFNFFPNVINQVENLPTKLKHSQNHSVVQSSFANPCHPLAGGFFSSFIPTKNSPSGTSFTVIVNDTRPIWFYCSQTSSSHCQSGMWFFCSKAFFSHSIYRYGRRNQCTLHRYHTRSFYYSRPEFYGQHFSARGCHWRRPEGQSQLD